MKNNLVIFLCIIIIAMLGYLVYKNSYPNEDVNKDGRVDALDLLIVQKKIIQDMEEGDKNDSV